MLVLYVVNAQADLEVCQNSNTNFIVDNNPALGSGDETATGSPGSTYAWAVTAGTLTQIIPGSNTANIDWTGVAVGTIVTITVIETNATGCETDPAVEFTVEIVTGPNAPTVVADPPAICSGDDAVFTITGTPGNVVSYTINGGGVQTTTILPTGEVDVIIIGVTANQTIVITSVATDASPTACTTNVTGVTATVTVNAAPVTSPIQVL
ncbi:hypothetical protein [Moheibacter sediminis]|nr:hypothetical protein [Moheibacter sediminis]